MYLVGRIIEKCEHSKGDWKEGAVGGRTLRIEESDYQCCGKQELVEEAEKLQEAGLIKINKWVTYGSDIESIKYRVENLPEFYRIAKRDNGEEFWSKQEKIEYYLTKVDDVLREEFQKPWIERYLESLKRRLSAGELPKGLARIDQYLACMKGLDSLEVPMLKRVFSKMYLKDSKVFEKDLQTKVIGIARKFCEDITEDMDNKTVLEQLMLEEYSQQLEIKGPLKIKIWKGAEARRVDLSDFIYGTVLNSQTLKHAMVELDQPSIRKVVTIENKANYVAMEYNPETLYIFSHGYFSPLEREFLIKLSRALNGKEVEYRHSGDLDYGGMKIFEYIQKRIFPEVQPLMMDVATYNKYEAFAQPIAEETLEKIRKTEIPEFEDLKEKLLETGKGIEQESFLTE